MRTETKFYAFDDKEFSTEEACLAYEATRPELMICNLTLDRVEAALRLEDRAIADAIETIGARIAKLRRESGDMKRTRKPKIENTDPNTFTPSEARAAIEKFGDTDWQAKVRGLDGLLATCRTEAELIDAYEAPEWINDAPAMIKVQCEQAYDAHRIRINNADS